MPKCKKTQKGYTITYHMKNEHVQVLTQDFLAPKAKDSTVQIFWKNEIKANLLVGRFMLA